VFIYTTYQNRVQTLNKLKKLDLFSQISVLTNNRLRLTTSKPVYLTDEKRIKKIRQKLKEIKTITPYAFYPFTKKVIKITKKKKTKRLTSEVDRFFRHIFFDIDSTLTHKGVPTINRKIKSLFEDFLGKNCNLYFCSGRSYQVIKRLTQRYGFGHEYGIAENGGIILGMGDADNGFRLKDNREPKKLRVYLMEQKAKKRLDFCEDLNQKNRKTEIVLDLNSISEKTLKKAIAASKAKVEYHKSKQAYHITTKGVNKGTAIEKLTSEELEVDPRIERVIGVGDSGLDLKMFEYCDEGYLVANADRGLNKQIKKNSRLNGKVHWLRTDAPEAVGELYKKLFQYG